MDNLPSESSAEEEQDEGSPQEIVDDGFVEEELGSNTMGMGHFNGFHGNALEDSFELHEKEIAAEAYEEINFEKRTSKDKVMDLFAKVDAMRIDSDEDDSDQEQDAAAVMKDDGKQQRLVIDFDVNYDNTDGSQPADHLQVLDQEGEKKPGQFSESNSESNLTLSSLTTIFR